MNSIVENVARERVEAVRSTILRSLRNAADGNPYAAETDRQRIRDRLQSKGRLTVREADSIAHTIEGIAASAADKELDVRSMVEREAEGLIRAAKPTAAAAEKVWGDSLDFVNVGFLAQGARTARSVGRIAYRNGRPLGSGFLIGPGLFLTNHHVVSSREVTARLAVEFDYELDLSGRPRAVTRFQIDPGVFVTDPVSGLDYTIIGLGPKIDGSVPLNAFGSSILSDAPDKHMLGEFANIVQHPQGRFKEVVLRENRLVSRFEDALHYVADTEPGSSGSPVYNSEWRVIALHHWGGPWIQQVDADGRPLNLEINEGIRISSIVKDIRARQAEIEPRIRARLLNALELGESSVTPSGPDPLADFGDPGRPIAASPRIDPEGRASWIVPIEISVQIPISDASGAQPVPIEPLATPSLVTSGEARPSRSYNDRQGYKPLFIGGQKIELPQLGDDLKIHAAVNKLAQPGDNEHELAYHHFSVVVNRTRKLAFFAACNINGATAKSIKRGTDIVTPLRPDSAGLESLADIESAEASDRWYHDDRLNREDYAGPEIYSGQRVPGFPNPRSSGRIARMFQRGHLVRRLDPAWGADSMALAAEADTFHWTNCSPQVGFFNQGSADSSLPGSGGGRLWRSVENYVLRNAVAEDQRVTCFTGPIFDDDEDRVYRTIRVPGRFFKIVAWAEGGELHALAMVADQRPVFLAWPEAIWTEGLAELAGGEAFQDPDELQKVADFLSSVAEIESLTGLDFGSQVRNADVRAEAESVAVNEAAEIPLRPGATARKSRKASGVRGPKQKN